MGLTVSQLQSIMTKLGQDKANLFFGPLVAAMQEFQINTPLRQAAFLAQIAHESYELKYMAEEWGPTPAQLNYDPPHPLAFKLGNTSTGDGYKYRGAGPLQLTGKAGFKEYGDALGLDLVTHPEIARDFVVGLRIAAMYWVKHGLNELADAKNFREITRRINGGYNGEAQREAYYSRACGVLGAV